MSYRATHLWSVLAKEERSVVWLARKAGCSRNYLQQHRSGRRPTLSDDLARRVADVFNLPVEAVFTRVNDTEATAAD
jgi:DNA-binding XRE family transcriptional regulator